MRNENLWKPTKFILADGRLRANGDPDHVSVASRLNVDLLARALQACVQQHACGRLLDLGCGNVPLYALYRPLVDDVLCVDWAQSAHDTQHLDQAADLNQPLELESASFDTVLLTDVLEHIAQPAPLMAEIRRVLKPGGMLIGSVPFLYRLHEEPHDHFRYTVHTLRRFAAHAGFVVTMLEAYGSGTDVLFDTLGKLLLTAHWRIGPRLAAWSQRAGWRLRDTSLGRHLNRNHSSMPIGYIFVLGVE
jgi:SAM-dependent methyltransferase